MATLDRLDGMWVRRADADDVVQRDDTSGHSELGSRRLREVRPTRHRGVVGGGRLPALDDSSEDDDMDTLPAGPPSHLDSDAIIDLPLSQQVVHGPDAVTFCGFLDEDIGEFDEAELAAAELADDAMIGLPPTAAPSRHEKLLPPPLTGLDTAMDLCADNELDDAILYPSGHR